MNLNTPRIIATGNHRRQRTGGRLLLNQACPPQRRSKRRGPLADYVDILLDMRVPPGDRFTRRRHFEGFGRYPGTLQHVVADLNAEGADYVIVPDNAEESAASPTLETLCRL